MRKAGQHNEVTLRQAYRYVPRPNAAWLLIAGIVTAFWFNLFHKN